MGAPKSNLNLAGSSAYLRRRENRRGMNAIVTPDDKKSNEDMLEETLKMSDVLMTEDERRKKLKKASDQAKGLE